MKISNLEDLTEFLKFYFSSDFKGVESSEEEEIKEVIKKSIKNINGSVEKIKSIAIIQLGRTDRYSPEKFIGNSKLILFITECLSEEDRKDLIIRYLNKMENYRGDKIVINTKILLSMMDYLPEQMKVNVLTHAKPIDLVRMMGEIHDKTMNYILPFKTEYKYYKKYYEIFKKALAE